EPVPFNLSELVHDVAEMLTLRAQEKEIDLAMRVAPDLPARFLGDSGRVRQVLTNLVGNAVKFTDRGAVTIEVRRGEGDYLQFDASDSGIGIPGDKLSHIFDKFTQADASPTRRFGGTGLGLAICRQLVELMGGRIAVTSEPGKGSTFSFSLP